MVANEDKVVRNSEERLIIDHRHHWSSTTGCSHLSQMDTQFRQLLLVQLLKNGLTLAGKSVPKSRRGSADIYCRSGDEDLASNGRTDETAIFVRIGWETELLCDWWGDGLSATFVALVVFKDQSDGLVSGLKP